MNNYRIKQYLTAVLGLGLLSMQPMMSSASDPDKAADSSIQFTDIAKLPGSGIHYQRTRSKNDALWAALRSKPVISMFDFGLGAPLRFRGAPGVAIFDYDGDGDLDIYVTNGPGKPNSLYSNQLMEGGGLTFIDVAKAAGVEATDMDSTGVCYGDIDNDGDYDLYVVGAGMKNRLFVNNGDGTFTDVTSRSDVGGRGTYGVGCSMGDVNGDGLLDIVVANTTHSWDNPTAQPEHNQLFLNKGNNVFQDISEESGITKLGGFPPEQAGAPALTWAIAMVDYDQDGDIDIVTADDQSFYPAGGLGGTKGLVHIFQNDGTGHFKDVVVEAGTNIAGAWMGFSFGDINFDGHLDMFVTNIGDYMNSEYFPYQIGEMASRWFLGQADGSFAKQEINAANATAFGWGTVMADYDNDGDTDIIYAGGMDGGPLIDVSNPGLIWVNDGKGNMTLDKRTLARRPGEARRNIQGLAMGDINNDGFIDLISVSDFDIPLSVPLTRYSRQWGSILDDTAYFVAAYTPIGPGLFKWAGYEFDDGTLAIDINSGGNKNGSASVHLLGTVGILQGSHSNRDGVGATVRFTPKRGKTVLHPVVAGDSYASQSALTAHFGLGKAREGTVDVLWPGGTRNRLYDVKKGEKVVLPEIPCSYADNWRHLRDYRECVDNALQQLVHKKLLSKGMQHRLYESAMKAYVSNGDRD